MINAYQKALIGHSVGIVFGSFAPLHQGHLDLIMKAKKQNDAGAIVIVCGYDGDKGEPLMPHAKRYRYVREFFADDDKVAVYEINDTEIGSKMESGNWIRWMTEVQHIITLTFNNKNLPMQNWYVGEEEYYQELSSQFHSNYMKFILCDREENPISATMIRKNPVAHWDKITFPFRRIFSHNILICGTASEGKTTLVQDLGKYFNAPYSHEYARDYMIKSCVSDWELDVADYMAFLEGQYNLNKSLINSPANHGLFFADTDSMVTKMYAEYYSQDKDCALTPEEYSQVAVTADALTAKCRWNKIFLLAPKGIYVDDNFRCMKHSELTEREKMFNILVRILQETDNFKHTTILNTGDYYANFATIRNYVEEVIKWGY